jgi:hypothetical protein
MHVKLEPRYQGAPRNTAGAGGGSKAAAAMSPTGPSGQIFCGELVGVEAGRNCVPDCPPLLDIAKETFYKRMNK